MNQITIDIPDGMELDMENSTFECIKFKPKSLTYKNIMYKLFNKKGYYFTDICGKIFHGNDERFCYDSNSATSKGQLEKLLAINKLMNVAKYLNDGCIFDWKDYTQPKWNILIDNDNKPFVAKSCRLNEGQILFKTKESAELAIKILGENEIRLALKTNY